MAMDSRRPVVRLKQYIQIYRETCIEAETAYKEHVQFTEGLVYKNRSYFESNGPNSGGSKMEQTLQFHQVTDIITYGFLYLGKIQN